jgi:hypothetical protein
MTPARYEVRDLPPADRRDGFKFGLWDTFTQEFVVGGGHFKLIKVAERQAYLYNDAYERAMTR